jgi:RNA polymerase sigma-70 factor (ECF subfamily)
VEDLVRRAQGGSSAAFGELVDRYESPLFNFLLRRAATPEDAEEIAQDAFVRAWRRIGLYDARWTFSTWLFTVARRLAATRTRSAAPRLQGSEALEDVRVHADPARELAREDDKMSLWSVADRVLDEDPRSALWLRYAEDLSIPEIAAILGRSSVSVRVMLFRARARLADHLAADRSGISAAVRAVGALPARRTGA